MQLPAAYMKPDATSRPQMARSFMRPYITVILPVAARTSKKEQEDSVYFLPE
jgi:hypothetical protein